MSELFKGVVKLSKEQFDTLKRDGTLTVGEQTITYEPKTTLYVTPDTTDAEIEELKANKQDKLTAGENITIDENNVISSAAGFDLSQLPKFTNKIYVDMSNKSTEDGVLSLKIVESSNIYIDWGDGTNTFYENAVTTIEHTYSDTAFVGWIYIYGDFKGIARNNQSSTDTVPYLTRVIYDNNITRIEDYSFYYCKSLILIEIPSTVTYVGKYAFYYCWVLDSISLPDKLERLSDYVFAYCWNLVRKTLPSKLFTIGKSAFYDNRCSNKIILPKNVGYIEANAFYSSFAPPTTVIVESDTLITMNDWSHFSSDSLQQILVKSKLVKLYKTATNWTTYADKIYPKNGQYSETVTIPAASWANNSATVEVVGSTSEARNIIEFMLVDADGNQIEDTYGLKATQGTMQMTFTCDVAPLEDIKIFVKSTLTNYD